MCRNKTSNGKSDGGFSSSSNDDSNKSPDDANRNDFEREVEERTRDFIHRSEKPIKEWESKGWSFARGIYRGVSKHSERTYKNKDINYTKRAVITIVIVIVAAYVMGTL